MILKLLPGTLGAKPNRFEGTAPKVLDLRKYEPHDDDDESHDDGWRHGRLRHGWLRHGWPLGKWLGRSPGLLGCSTKWGYLENIAEHRFQWILVIPYVFPLKTFRETTNLKGCNLPACLLRHAWHGQHGRLRQHGLWWQLRFWWRRGTWRRVMTNWCLVWWCTAVNATSMQTPKVGCSAHFLRLPPKCEVIRHSSANVTPV